ncbi:MAG: 3'-5' exonuclease, partial [Alphaproteobacteria bacterium]
AYERAPHRLWQELARRADEDAAFAAAHGYLAGLMRRVDFTPPYELFAAVLGGHGDAAGKSGRERMLARLGPEAEEPLDEFLALALAYERSHVPSLEGFLHWVQSGKAEIKRDPEAGSRNEVRIMTVHGAKGLEAPIVILPDTVQTPAKTPRLLWLDGGEEGLLWPPRRTFEAALARTMREAARCKRQEEYRRLLYVAMTRAEDRLYVCGWRGQREVPADSWWSLVHAGLEGSAESFDFDCTEEIADGWSGPAWRLASPQEAAPERERAMGATMPSGEPLPPWARQQPTPEPIPARPLAPSRPAEEEPAARSPLGPDAETRFRRGLLVHRLLEALPELPLAVREAACRRYLARSAHGLDEPAREEIARETLAVLADPAFAALFGPGSRAEVPLVGEVNGTVISGQIDRLLVGEAEILIVDYKTNRAPPTAAAGVAVLYLKQMAAYRALLARIYPGRRTRAALLFTDGPRLMLLPDGLLDAHAP